MKFSTIYKVIVSSICVSLLLSISSCVKDKFDAPPISNNADPAGLYATTTISQLKLNYYIPNQNNIAPSRIPDSVIISGIINADDKSGNFYKVLSLQDSTGGIQVKVDASSLYNDYPVGRRVFIKCKGLYIYNYLGTIEIGGYVDTTGSQPSLGGIPATNISYYIVKGMSGVPVPVKTFTIPQLNAADPLNQQSTLVQLNGVEFIITDTAKTYADAINKGFGNLLMEDCLNYQVTVRSSGYADFANTNVPNGHGSITGVFTIYNTSTGPSNQLAIRDLKDIKLSPDSARCF